MAYKAVAGGIGFIIGILFLGIWEVTFWDTLAFGLMAAGTALVAGAASGAKSSNGGLGGFDFEKMIKQ